MHNWIRREVLADVVSHAVKVWGLVLLLANGVGAQVVLGPGNQAGRAGEIVDFQFAITGSQAAATATARFRLALDPATAVIEPVLKDAATGEVDCTIASDLSSFVSTGPVLYQPLNKRVVIGFGDLAIPVQPFGRDGAILSCKFKIKQGTPPGPYPLACGGAPTASTADGALITSTCTNGVLTVTSGNRCIGDANNDGAVSLGELQQCTNSFLGSCTGPPGYCGNGVLDTGEDCDFGTLNGKTCVSQGFISGTLECGANCVFDTRGCVTAPTPTRTATPTATHTLGPEDCCDATFLCGPPSGGYCPIGVPVFNAYCDGATGKCVAKMTPTPTVAIATPTASVEGQCGNGTIDTGEDCDIGGTCAGGSKSGISCISDADCGAGEPGVCDGGTRAFRQCEYDGECGGGRCDRCRTYGGQSIPGDSAHTCAANCTFETRVPFVLKGGQFAGSTLASGSGEVIHSGILGDVPLPLTGSETLTIGKSGTYGISPVVVKAVDIQFPAIPVGGTLACACVRGIGAKTCGGFVFDGAGNAAQDCSDGFSVAACPQYLPCTFVHGPGNAGSGHLGCNGLVGSHVSFSQESRGSADPYECLTPDIGAPTCADFPTVTLGDSSANPGTMVIFTDTAIGVKRGVCGSFCTNADPQSQRGTVGLLILTTDTATGLVTNVDGQDGVNNGPYSVTGTPKSCVDLRNGTPTGARLAGTYTGINENMLGDVVVEEVLEAQ